MKYTTLTDPNAVPQYGQSGPQVIALQAQYNQAHMNEPGFTPLATDGDYGPLTYQALNGKPYTGPGIVSSGSVAGDIKNASNGLDTMMRQYNPTYVNPNDPNANKNGTGAGTGTTTDVNVETVNDPYTRLLDTISSRSDDATKMLISTINANRANKGEEITKNYDNYVRGLRTLGVENGFESTPDIIKGQILQSQNDKMDKLAALDTEQVKAIAEANQARDNKDFKLMKDKMDYVNELKKQKLDALKSISSDEDQYMQKANFFADSLYSQLSGLSSAQKAAALKQLSEATGIPENYIVAATASVAAKKKTGGSGGGGISKAQIQAGTQALEANKGADGKVDPYFYYDAYKNWTQNGGTTKTFVANFPPKFYVNPAATNLPDYLMPPKTKASATGVDANGIGGS